MVTNLQRLAYFLNLLSIEHYLEQFWAKFQASSAHIKCMGTLQTVRQSQNESKFQPNSSIFSFNTPLRSLYCNFNCSNMLLWSTVIQITQIQLSINTHFWVDNWKPHIEFFLGRPPCIYTIWPTEVKSYNSCTAITHFLTPGTHTQPKITMRIIHPRWYRPTPLAHGLYRGSLMCNLVSINFPGVWLMLLAIVISSTIYAETFMLTLVNWDRTCRKYNYQSPPLWIITVVMLSQCLWILTGMNGQFSVHHYVWALVSTADGICKSAS